MKPWLPKVAKGTERVMAGGSFHGMEEEGRWNPFTWVQIPAPFVSAVPWAGDSTLDFSSISQEVTDNQVNG